MMAEQAKTIAILVSFFGECPGLKAFLDSLAGQTFSDFRLLYRFDGPVPPEVPALLEKYPFAEKLGDERRLGIPGTYWELLLRASSFRFLMFADQDDLWHPDKIEKSFAAIRKYEAQYGEDTPLLLHSDLRVTDLSGKLIAPSFFRYQSLNPRRNRLKDLIVQNNVTGCTMIFNRALAAYLTKPVPAICHDWYLALIASAFGKIHFISEPLIDYQQHAGNHFGAVPVASFLNRKIRRKELHERLVLTQKQALLFCEEYRSLLPAQENRILEAWGKNLSEPSYFKRLFSMIRFHFRKNDWRRTIGMWLAL